MDGIAVEDNGEVTVQDAEDSNSMSFHTEAAVSVTEKLSEVLLQEAQEENNGLSKAEASPGQEPNTAVSGTHGQKAPEPVVAGRGRPRKSDAPKKLDEVQQSNIESKTDFMLVTPSLKRGRGRPPNPFKVIRPKPETTRSVGRPRIHPPKTPSGRGPGRPRIHPPKDIGTKRFARPFNMKSLQIKVKCTQRGDRRRGRPPGSKNKKKNYIVPKVHQPPGRPIKSENEKESMSYQDFVRQVNEELLAIHGTIPGINKQIEGAIEVDNTSDDLDSNLELDEPTEDNPISKSLHLNVSTENNLPLEKHRGRPPGSKNKPKDFDTSGLDLECTSIPATFPSGKRKGRPPGAKNKPKDIFVLTSDSENNLSASPSIKKRGRPPGAKNKPKEISFLGSDFENNSPSPQIKKRGRPPGAKNKPKDFSFLKSYSGESVIGCSPCPTEKRRPGRPLGSKDKFSSGRRRGRLPGAKNKLNFSFTRTEVDQSSADESSLKLDFSPVRRPGRPLGAKNKPKSLSFNEHNTSVNSHLRILFRSPSLKRKPGRPPLAENKHKSDTSDQDHQVNTSFSLSGKRRPGRPPGAKNKPKPKYSSEENNDENLKTLVSPLGKRSPGRPPGAKNKPKLDFEVKNEGYGNISFSHQVKRRPGRPPGAKNKPKLIYSMDTKSELTEGENELSSEPSSPTKKRGRPPGSKNKLKLALSPQMFVKMDTGEISGVFDNSVLTSSGKRRPGRPPGAKNKPKIYSWVKIDKESRAVTDQTPKIKRKPGRPRGSKNKIPCIEADEIKPRHCKSDTSYTEVVENVVEEEFSESEEGENDTEVQKRGPGRPSKNRESAIKRKRGRPPGSLNKKKKLSGSLVPVLYNISPETYHVPTVNQPSATVTVFAPEIVEGIMEETTSPIQQKPTTGRRQKTPINYAAMAEGALLTDSDMSEDEGKKGTQPETVVKVSVITSASETDWKSMQEKTVNPENSNLIKKRGRGRPKKSDQTKRPGRPKSIKTDTFDLTLVEDVSDTESSGGSKVQKKKLGRPKKVDSYLNMTGDEEQEYDPSGISGITMEGWEGFTGAAKEGTSLCNGTVKDPASVSAKLSVSDQPNLHSFDTATKISDTRNEKRKTSAVAFVDDVVIIDSDSNDKFESVNVENSDTTPDVIVKNKVPEAGSFCSVVDLSNCERESSLQNGKEGNELNYASSNQINSSSLQPVISTDTFRSVASVSNHLGEKSVVIDSMPSTVVDIMLTSEPACSLKNEVTENSEQNEVTVTKIITESLPQNTNSGLASSLFVNAPMS